MEAKKEEDAKKNDKSSLKSTTLLSPFTLHPSPLTDKTMVDEKIKVRVTETGQVLEVVVLNKRAERIQVVLGEGIHSVKCDLSPTRNGMGYAGSAMGRELIYERSRVQVQADIDRLNPALRKSR